MRLLILLSVLFTLEDVTLKTPTGDVYGTLLRPDSSRSAAVGMTAVAIIISGSGPTDRDGNSPLLSGKNDSLKMLAEGLAKQGIASLRYDKRGIAASKPSAPSESDLRFDTYVDDAVAWGQKLRKDPRFATVSYVGHSEGALIGVIAAQKLPADKVVSISGAGQPAADLILAQLYGKVPSGLYVAASNTVDALKAGHTVANPPPELVSLFRTSVQPYLISWFRYDPSAEIGKLKVPVLIVQGENDVQVSTYDAQRLAEGNKKAKLILIPGMNHVLKDVDRLTQAKSYSDPTMPIDATLVDSIATFLKSGDLPPRPAAPLRKRAGRE